MPLTVCTYIKDRDSRFLWANENFVRLIGPNKQEVIGSIDTNEEHKAHNRGVMNGGEPQVNFNESIDAVLGPGTLAVPVDITTQKGLLKYKSFWTIQETSRSLPVVFLTPLVDHLM